MRLYALLATLAALSASASPVEPRASCTDVTVFFARGTSESGTLGSIVGPPFQTALQSALGGRSLSFVGIPYPATVAGFLAGGDQGGAQTMASNAASIASSCPNTKIFISGYSQGAQVTHLAAGKMTSAVQSRIKGAVLFGDPDNGQAFPGGIVSKTYCASGDNICAGGILVLPPHLSYGANAGDAAAFVVSRL